MHLLDVRDYQIWMTVMSVHNALFRFLQAQMPDPKTYKQHFENKHPKSELPDDLKEIALWYHYMWYIRLRLFTFLWGMLHCWVLWTNTAILICLDNTCKLLSWPSFSGGRWGDSLWYFRWINTSSSCLKCNKFSSEWSCFRPLASFVCVKKLKEKVSKKHWLTAVLQVQQLQFLFWQKWTGRAHYTVKLADFIYYVFIQMEWAA